MSPDPDEHIDPSSLSRSEDTELGPVTGSALYHRVVSPDDFIMRKIWDRTPWMVQVWMGGADSTRLETIKAWCREHYGHEAQPIQGVAGDWHCGRASMKGRTWFGFRTEAMLKAFDEAWPTAGNSNMPFPGK